VYVRVYVRACNNYIYTRNEKGEKKRIIYARKFWFLFKKENVTFAKISHA